MPEVITFGGITITYLVEGAASNGSAGVFEMLVQPGGRVPAPHSHDAFEETLYGLEGVGRWTVEGEVTEVRPGNVLCIPRGRVHGFTNPGDVPFKHLVIATPAVFGPEFFRDIATAFDANGVPDPARVGEVMRRHGLTPAV